MKKLLFFLTVIAVISGCKKDDDVGCPKACQNGGTLQVDCSCVCPNGYSGTLCENDNRPYCEKNSIGWIVFDNYEPDPYICYVDGSNKGTVSAWGRLEVEVSKGYHTVRALQQSGYYIYPTDLTNSVTVTQCYEYTWRVDD